MKQLHKKPRSTGCVVDKIHYSGAQSKASEGAQMSEPELSVEAKYAIQRYMLKFVIPSGVVLAIVSTTLGFVVSGLARIEASSEATRIALQAVQDSATAKANAAKAAEDAKALQEKVEAAAKKSEDTSAYLLSVKDQVDKVLTGQYEGLAKSLFAIKEFRDAIQTIPQKEIAEFNARFLQIDAVLYNGNDALVAPSASCPPGTYVASINQVSVSGGAHGFLESVNYRCKALRFERPK
jgi:hypothetical protein